MYGIHGPVCVTSGSSGVALLLNGSDMGTDAV